MKNTQIAPRRKRLTSSVLTITGVLVLWLLSPIFINAAPKADLWDFWTKRSDASQATINHDSWDQLLKSKTQIDPKTGTRLVGYASFDAVERKQLQGYINRLTSENIANYSSEEQKAYWINLYNAVTVDLILRHYPVKSITKIDISPGLFSFGPWDKKLLKISGQDVSLNDIEHRILRPIWKDLRIHYAVNCASISCPNLAGQAYTAANTEELLEKGARDYINNSRGVAFEKDGDLRLSSIYDWYQVDFGDSEQKLLEHFAQYAKPALKTRLQDARKADIEYDYDWSLNEYK